MNPLIIPKTGDLRHRFTFVDGAGVAEDISTTTPTVTLRRLASADVVVLTLGAGLTQSGLANAFDADVDRLVLNSWGAGPWVLDIVLTWPGGYEDAAASIPVSVREFGASADSGVSEVQRQPDGTRVVRVASGPPGPSASAIPYTAGGGVELNVLNFRLAAMPAGTLKGNSAGVAAAPADLTAGQVKILLGLNLVDNTADADKPVSTAQAAAIAARLAASALDVDAAFTANSDAKVPSQKAAKSYIDTGLATKLNISAVDIDVALAANSDAKVASQKAIKAYADAGLALKLNLSALDTDVTLAANSDVRVASQKAIKSYVNDAFAANDALLYKGAIDCSANPNYPAANAGETYRFSVAGKIGGGAGPNVQAGDMAICHTDNTAAGTHAAVGAAWNVIQLNIDGALTTADLGVSVMGYSAALAQIAALAAANDDVLQRKAGAWTNRTPAQLKADLALVKADVGLGNADNTSDANKPVSTAAQTALNAKNDTIQRTTTVVTSSSSYAIPAWAKWLQITAIAPGGGGGSGAAGDNLGHRSGGGGGGAGGISTEIFYIADLANSSLTVTVGAAGTGGAAIAATSSAGNNGTAGGDTTVADGATVILAAGGGLFGAGGPAVTTTGAGGVAGYGQSAGNPGGAAGATASNHVAGSSAVGYAPGSGAGGAGLASNSTAVVGKVGGDGYAIGGSGRKAAGGAAGATGAAGGAAAAKGWAQGMGAGGGSGGSSTTGGGDGGAGSVPGGGGGGGAATRNTANSGAGGDAGGGSVYITAMG